MSKVLKNHIKVSSWEVKYNDGTKRSEETRSESTKSTWKGSEEEIIRYINSYFLRGQNLLFFCDANRFLSVQEYQSLQVMELLALS